MIDLTIHEDQLERAVRRAREQNIIIPTFNQMQDPSAIPDSIRDQLAKVGLWDLNPLNLFRITWHNEPVESGGGFGGVNYLEFPRELTGVEARIIAATNSDLKSMVKEKKFREDLYYRLNVIHIHLVPLRERVDDIVPLMEHFLNKFSINDFILKAVVKTLKDLPRMNSVFNETELIYKSNVNLGIAVASPRGLVVPVVHKAENLSLLPFSPIGKRIPYSPLPNRLISPVYKYPTYFDLKIFQAPSPVKPCAHKGHIPSDENKQPVDHHQLPC